MADQPRIEIHGLDELASGSRVLSKRIGDTAAKRFDSVAQKTAGRVRTAVPHISGDMAASVFSAPVEGGAQVGYDGSAQYAGWVDFGGTRGRDYVPQGRYLYPIVGDAPALLTAEATRAAEDEIKGMQWPTPT